MEISVFCHSISCAQFLSTETTQNHEQRQQLPSTLGPITKRHPQDGPERGPQKWLTWLGRVRPLYASLCHMSPVVSTQAPCTPKVPGVLAVQKKRKTPPIYSQVFDQYVRYSGSILKENKKKSSLLGLAPPINRWTQSSPYLEKLLAL